MTSVQWTSRQITGVVVSAGKMMKTVKVQVQKQKWNKRIQKHYATPRSVLVSDPTESVREGDVVSIRAGLRLSKLVRHVVTNIVAPMGPPLSQRPPLLSHSEQLAVLVTKLDARDAKQAANGNKAAKQRIKDRKAEQWLAEREMSKARLRDNGTRRKASEARHMEQRQQKLAKWKVENSEESRRQELRDQRIADLEAELAIEEKQRLQRIVELDADEAQRAAPRWVLARRREKEDIEAVATVLRSAKAEQQQTPIVSCIRVNGLSRVLRELQDLNLTTTQKDALDEWMTRCTPITKHPFTYQEEEQQKARWRQQRESELKALKAEKQEAEPMAARGQSGREREKRTLESLATALRSPGTTIISPISINAVARISRELIPLSIAASKKGPLAGWLTKHGPVTQPPAYADSEEKAERKARRIQQMPAESRSSMQVKTEEKAGLAGDAQGQASDSRASAETNENVLDGESLSQKVEQEGKKGIRGWLGW